MNWWIRGIVFLMSRTGYRWRKVDGQWFHPFLNYGTKIMIPLKLRFSPIYSLTFSSRKSVNCKPGRKVVKQIVNIRKIINLLFTSFTFFSKCMSLEYAKLQSQITDQKMPRSGMNRPKISIVLRTHKYLSYEFFFSKKFSTSNYLFH